MAPPRKSKPVEPGRPVHLRLPTAIFERIEAQAQAEDRPMNRVIVDDLAAIPLLKGQVQLGKLLAAMDKLLTHYGSRLVMADLADQLHRAVDHALAAQAANNQMELLARLDGMRVLRTAMLGHERQAKERPNLSEIAPAAHEPDGKADGE
jgi:hypothetical protein